MHTIPKDSHEAVGGRRRRRVHSAEFKAQVVAACIAPGASVAAVAMAHGVNANLARCWVAQAESGGAIALSAPVSDAVASTFVPVQVPMVQTPAPDIRLELRRGATTINVSWPCAAASECAQWVRELLR